MQCPVCRNDNPQEALFCGVCSEVLGKKTAALASAAAAPVAIAPPAPSPGSLWSPALAAVGAALFALLVLTRHRIAEGFGLVDFVNLAFHEGGHVIFGLPGNRFIMVSGGTLMQLMIPLAAAVHFLKRRERVSACVALFWFGQNFLGIGKYVADARAQMLELVAGGVHDWTYLLETLGLLTHDVGLGAAVEVLGCLIMAASVVAGFVYWRTDKKALL